MPACRTTRKRSAKYHPYNATNRLAAKRLKYSTSFLNPRKRLAGPWPEFMDTQLRYFDGIPLDAAVGSIATNVFRANSLFDPDFTNVGHQPRGFDQWAAMYNKYIVTSARITVRASYSADTGGNAGIVFVSTNTNSGPYTSAIDAMEDNRVKWKVVEETNNSMVYDTYVHRDFWTSNPYDDDNAGALVTANPFNTVFFIVGAACLNTAQNPGDFTVMVQIDYKVRFYDHVEAGLS